MTRLFVAVLLLLCLPHLEANQGQPVTKELIEQIPRLLRWQAFWKGMDSLREYATGKTVDVTVVQGSQEAAVFISSIGVAIHYTLSDGRVANSNIASMPDETNVSAANRYLLGIEGSPGFVIKPGSSVGSDFPIRSESDIERRREFIQISVPIILPRLTPPNAIRVRQVPSNMDYLTSLIRKDVVKYYSPVCGPGDFLIPYFSSEDPVIYTYVNLGLSCGQGILILRRTATGSFEVGQFSLDRPPNDWSITRRRIQENSFVRMSLP